MFTTKQQTDYRGCSNEAANSPDYLSRLAVQPDLKCPGLPGGWQSGMLEFCAGMHTPAGCLRRNIRFNQPMNVKHLYSATSCRTWVVWEVLKNCGLYLSANAVRFNHIGMGSEVEPDIPYVGSQHPDFVRITLSHPCFVHCREIKYFRRVETHDFCGQCIKRQ